MQKQTVLSFVVLLMSVTAVSAHALLESVSPAKGATVPGPEVALLLHFNAKIDNAHSRLELVTPDKKTVVLSIDPQQKPGDIGAHARDLKPGAYTLRWQVLAVDGHITHGDVPFTVK